MIALERQNNNHKKYTFQGPGIQGDSEDPPTDTFPRFERRMGIRKAGRILATALALQAPIQVFAHDRISRADNNNAAILASAGVHYSSIAQEEAAPEPKSPSLATNNTSPQPEMSPAEPKNVEQSKCINEWEKLSDGVCFTQFREYGSDVYAVRVDLKNPKVSVRPSFVEGPGRLGRLRDSAERQDATAAMNLSFFTADGHPIGPIFVDGKWIHTDPSPQQVLIVNKDNTSGILPTKQALTKDTSQMKFALSGSHVLVHNGIATENFGTDNAGQVLEGHHPRTAIGVDTEGHFYMVVVDGRSNKSPGVTMSELRGIMKDKFNVDNATAHDGGGSTRLYVKKDNKKGEIRNNPSNRSREIATGVFVLAA